MRIDRPKLFVMLLIAAALLTHIGRLAAQTTQPQPQAPAADVTLDAVKPAAKKVFTATKTGNMLNVTTPGQTISNAVFVGYTDPRAAIGTGQGRGVMVFAPHTTIENCKFIPGDDDPLGFLGDCHGSLVINCDFEVGDRRLGQDKGIIVYTDASSSAKIGPTFGYDDGYAVEYRNCRFKSSPRLSAGVTVFRDCEFVVNALHGINLMDGKINLINCRFVEIDKPADASYWYQADGSCPIRIGGADARDRSKNLKSKIYAAGCTIEKRLSDGTVVNRRAVTAQQLCRRHAAPDAKPGFRAYQGPGSVPAKCFRKTPILN